MGTKGAQEREKIMITGLLVVIAVVVGTVAQAVMVNKKLPA